MLHRCTDPTAVNWGYYGGRGIAVDPQWFDFKNFRADMGDRPHGKSIDRIDNSKGYGPSNCRWATRSEQQQNSRNAKLTADDVRWIRANTDVTNTECAARFGVSCPQISLIRARKKWKNVA